MAQHLPMSVAEAMSRGLLPTDDGPFYLSLTSRTPLTKTPEQAAEAMREIVATEDEEAAHGRADKLMGQLLATTEYAEVARIYDGGTGHGWWYS